MRRLRVPAREKAGPARDFMLRVRSVRVIGRAAQRAILRCGGGGCAGRRTGGVPWAEPRAAATRPRRNLARCGAGHGGPATPGFYGAARATDGPRGRVARTTWMVGRARPAGAGREANHG